MAMQMGYRTLVKDVFSGSSVPLPSLCWYSAATVWFASTSTIVMYSGRPADRVATKPSISTAKLNTPREKPRTCCHRWLGVMLAMSSGGTELLYLRGAHENPPEKRTWQSTQLSAVRCPSVHPRL